MVRLEVRATWDGLPAPAGEWVRFDLARHSDHLVVDVEAPFHGDPPPPGPPGPTDRLWEFEVAELFVCGADERYLELELAPGGHHLALQLAGRRRVLASGLPLDYAARIEGGRWRGHARVPLAWLPAAPYTANAYAIHGRGPGRRHLAAWPVPGPAPDFHRLERFRPLVL